MTKDISKTGADNPRAILFATDLSARCDRALDRAALISSERGKRLVILHAIEDGPSASDMLDSQADDGTHDPVDQVRRDLIREVSDVVQAATVVIERGTAAESITRAARHEGAELIVLGIARGDLLGRYILGNTVDQLIRGAPAPLLIVKARARAPYRHIVVATDFSESSRQALETAMRLFPQRRVMVFHAFEPMMEGLISDVGGYRRDARAAALAEGARFINETPVPDGALAPELHVERGEPAQLLRNYVSRGDADLVVIGSHGRSALFEIFVGSVAKRIIEHLPCDALLVRDRQAVP